MEKFDVLVLGAGPGGYPAAIRASQLGLKTATVEKYKVGGTCLHWGCIPTKVILESAEVLTFMRNGPEYGLSASGIDLDYSKVSARREKIVSTNHKGTEYLLKKNNVTTFIGEARLTAPTRAVVKPNGGGEEIEIEANDVIIATGSFPKSLPGLNIDGKRIINSDQAVTLTELPGSVIILGAGAIGVEFASGWNDMGVDVTLVEVLPTILPLEDKELGQELSKLMSRRGVKIKTGAKVLIDSVQAHEDRVELEVEQNGNRERLSAQYLLVATGRGPVTNGLGLEELGVKLERGFVQVDDHMRTGIPHLYAIGDVAGGLMLAHKATAEGLLAAATIAGQTAHAIDPNRIPRCTYSRPQVASMGMSEDEATRQGHKVKIGKFPFRASGMALVLGERDGFTKMVTDEESGEILGVHMLGPRVTELISTAGLARLLECTPEEVGLNIYPHPTLSEAMGEAAHAVDGMSINF